MKTLTNKRILKRMDERKQSLKINEVGLNPKLNN